MKKIATVPYAPGKSYDFYSDHCVINGEEIEYDQIEGYGYLLTHKSNSVYFIPVANSTSFSFDFDLGGNIFHSVGTRAMHYFSKGNNKRLLT
ncbi:MAG: hypothetical protein NTX11_03505 [Candidatus Saccharibacteria bacterium]|nr:hypothetical protein [Candidatus Saccharibacteria bacterium]